MGFWNNDGRCALTFRGVRNQVCALIGVALSSCCLTILVFHIFYLEASQPPSFVFRSESPINFNRKCELNPVYSCPPTPDNVALLAIDYAPGAPKPPSRHALRPHFIMHSASPMNPLRNRLVSIYFQGIDPFCTFRNRFAYTPLSYFPYTHINPYAVEFLIKSYYQTGFFVEAGSMQGGSAIITAKTIEEQGLSNRSTLLCLDPFTGDVNMWVNYLKYNSWLSIKDGSPRISDIFMLNVLESYLQHIILPLIATSIVGMRSIKRLQLELGLPKVDVMYLDSAHEEDETFFEAKCAWDILRDGGMLYGDDWNLLAIAKDITRFAKGTPCAQYYLTHVGTLSAKCEIEGAADHVWPPDVQTDQSFLPIETRSILRVNLENGQWYLKKVELPSPNGNEIGSKQGIHNLV